MRWLEGIINSAGMSLSELWEIAKDREAWQLHPWGCEEADVTGWLNNNKVKDSCFTTLCWLLSYITNQP